MDDAKPAPDGGKDTIESLRLNMDEALKGRTWLLLPEGFRIDHGNTYPLPSSSDELRRIAVIPMPPRKKDSGCLYIRRAIKMLKSRQHGKMGIGLEGGWRENRMAMAQVKVTRAANQATYEMQRCIEKVRDKAQETIASFNDLLTLSRQGLEGQMRAHMTSTTWQGERVDGDAFRQCVRLVTQAVKSLGLPADERAGASQAIMEQAAEAIRDMQSAAGTAPSSDTEQ